MAKTEVLSHWYLLIEDFQTSALDFYTAVEEAIARREIPDVELSRVDWKEGGVLTAKREYLRVSREKLAFDICAAPFGNGYFFSWWLARLPPAHPFLWALGFFVGFAISLRLMWEMGLIISALLVPAAVWLLGKAVQEGVLGTEEYVVELPYIGWIYERLFRPTTYYKLDTALMYQESVRNAVLEVIDELRTQKGLRALSEDERAPRLRDLSRP